MTISGTVNVCFAQRIGMGDLPEARVQR